MITAHIERLADNMEELKAHFGEHHAELALHQEEVGLDPDYPKYFALEEMGKILCVVLRDRGQVIAYFVGMVDTALHSKGCLTLQQDIFWLHPQYRDQESLTQLEAHMLALQLFEAVREEAIRRGVKRWYAGSKWHKDASRVFEELKMQPADVYYTQWLGG